jgi:hypothetical protein
MAIVFVAVGAGIGHLGNGVKEFVPGGGSLYAFFREKVFSVPDSVDVGWRSE